MKITSGIISFFIAFAFLTLPSFSMAQSVEREIKSFVTHFEKIYNSGDAQAVTALFTDDAIIIGSDNQQSNGKTAVRAYYQQFFANMSAKAQIGAGEIISLPGNYSYVTGPYTIDATIKANGQKVKIIGSYATLAQKINGKWKVGRMMLMVPTPPQS